MKLSPKQLTHIRDIALDLYKNTAARPNQDASEFLGQCMAQSVIRELNRIGLVTFDLELDPIDIDYHSQED